MSLKNQECKNPLVYQEVNSLICEYLELNGLEKTVTTFTDECRAKALPCPVVSTDQESKASFSHYDADKMLKSFDEGGQEAFFKMWLIFQAHIQSATSDMQKLEVYLRVHFALWPKAHREPESVQVQSMHHLKTFFEEYASKLSNDTSVLPLFALPYVSDPESHPIFRDLFHPDWTVKLRVQLEITVRRYFDLLEKNISQHSKLVSLVIKSQDGSATAIPGTTVSPLGDTTLKMSKDNNLSAHSDYYRDRFFQLVETYRKIRKLLKGTRDSYGKLLKVANELIMALELSVNGQGIALDPILQKCNLIFPEIFTPMDSITSKPDMEYFKALATGPCFDKMLDSDVSLFFLGISDMNPDSLDYPKIKTVLSADEVNYMDKLLLLQALRWLLTKTTTKCRKDAMDAFIAKDLLGLCDKSVNYRSKIFSVMLSPNPTYIKECFSRLLNALASTSSGRKYMSNSNYCLEILVKSLLNYKDESESFICQMIVATLQKLSLRKKMRLGMIDRKVIQWVIFQLKTDLAQQQKELSEMADGKASEQKPGTSEGETSAQFRFNPYLMEYSWALLMNLCLHDESMGPTSAIAPDILTSIVQTLLNQPSKEVAPYVISTLYSILRNEQIFDMAKRMQLETVFASLLQQTDSEIAMHLHQVLAILYVRGRDRLAASSEVDYDDDENPDPDDFEPELELHESWTAVLEEEGLSGDDLLLRQYMATCDTEDAVIPFHLTPTSLEKQGILVRPTTPKPLDQRVKVSQQKISVQIHQTVEFSDTEFPIQKGNIPPNTSATKTRRKNSKDSPNFSSIASRNGGQTPSSSSKAVVALGPSYEQIPLSKGKTPLGETQNSNGKKNPVRKSVKQASIMTDGKESEMGFSETMLLAESNATNINGSSNEPNHNKFETEDEKPVTKSPKVKRMVKKSKKVRT